MKATTAGLLFAAVISVSLCNVRADEPASLAPLYEAMAAPVTAQEPACLDCLYEALDEAATSKACPCDGEGDCECGDACDCKPKFTRTRTVSKPPRPELKNEPSKPLATGDAAPTPITEISRIINWMPKPEIGFVDFGCGYDARWCIAAAEKWGCKVTGVEIDPGRAAAARERVRNLGLSHLITIIEGDATTTDVQGDIAAVYLYPDVLAKLKPRLEKFRIVASYMHAVPGLPMVKSGDSWFYTRPRPQPVQVQVQTQRPAAVWQGMAYSAPVCTSGNCQMCQSIRYQLGN